MGKLSETYTLNWISAARPPVHPNARAGSQTFASFDKAVTFFRKMPDDTRLVSVTKIVTREYDGTRTFADAIWRRAALSPENGGENHG